jgi:SAM-dependent methyltransferase
MSHNPFKVAWEEVRHWVRPHWSFADVGDHWDHTEEYDAVNEETYSYYRRFIDGYRLGADYIPDGAHILDFCSRTGNGTLHFYERGKIGSAVCADVSKAQGAICRRVLREAGFQEFVWVEVSDYRMPFADGQFEAILCFETIEHFSRPERLVAELGRVTHPGGIMILTTPNVLWEPVHALAAIAEWHHSEGPHRFIRYKRLLGLVTAAGFEIEQAETTVLIPSGPQSMIELGERIEAKTKKTLMPWLGLRRILICRKL